ncbi:MAG: class I SAM-dependent methyltransferase [Lachnospiraceae bacterium]|nr:class I SAM-dependent methyltransferase [Lachnospiraceae bacterium]
MNRIEEFYNKFNEDKRLKTRHGSVEYSVTLHYIMKYINKLNPSTVVDIGAGTGAYTLPILHKANQVIAIDLVKYNLGRLKQNVDKLDPESESKLTCYKRDARKLRAIDDNISDMTLLLGPMYHLDTLDKRKKALSEAIRITKPGGVIFVGYIMNEYAVIMHGFNEHTILDDIDSGRLDDSFKINNEDRTYCFARLEDIDEVNKDMSVKRDTIFSPDGAANYLRPMLNSLSEEEFEEYINYQLRVSERKDLLGASAHVVDVLKVE